MKTILIVDDEKDIVDLLKYNIQKEGYGVLTARNGKQALELAQQQPHLILLDVMMPELDGWQVVKKLKGSPKTGDIPIVFLTAKGSDVDEVLGLELGADDYIVKPVSIPKLLARIRTIFRKQELKTAGETSLSIGSIEILPTQHIVRIDSKEVFFPKKEFEVLAHLAKYAGQVVKRESLLNAVWGSDVLVVDRTIDVHIRKIREKLGRHAGYIETIKGVGYRFREPED
ncbi:MAG TPA: response regulator transcription factor [Bacteroidota bacterium]|jgi:two-component system alkaline phosphatase synthesis response regulator PhoP|nr:response regulator transcription factor [Bacteroidota bacterium]